ncbi:MAG: exopolysaccharide biosynthesis polyprenyl glycosylphosphotransferase, partial [Planctomycetota bacterium]
TERPLPPLRVEALLAALAASCFLMAVVCLVLEGGAPVELLCAAPVLTGLGIYLQRRWAEARPRGDTALPAALFSETREGVQAAQRILRPIPGLEVRTVVLPESVADRSPVGGLPVQAPASDLRGLLEAGARLFLVDGAGRRDLRSILGACAGAGFHVESVPDVAARVQGKVNLEDGEDLKLLARLTGRPVPWAAGQRAVDLIVSSALFLLLLPLAPLVALAIVIGSRGAVFYRQERVGRHGETFRMLKFRTMRADAEAESGPVWAGSQDPRITGVGRFLRRFRLDELPQLWNVIRGHMSLVGPRPERPFFVEQLSRKLPLYAVRHCVRPGVTGWAQIRYPYAASDRDAEHKLAYDLFYIDNRSLTFYFTVLLETAKVVLFRRGAR